MLYDDESTRFLIHTPRFVVSTRWVATHMNALTTNPSVYIWIDKTLRGFFSVVLRYFESFLALWKNKLTAVLFIDFKAGNSYLTFFVSKIKYIVNQPAHRDSSKIYLWSILWSLFIKWGFFMKPNVVKFMEISKNFKHFRIAEKNWKINHHLIKKTIWAKIETYKRIYNVNFIMGIWLIFS